MVGQMVDGVTDILPLVFNFWKTEMDFLGRDRSASGKENYSLFFVPKNMLRNSTWYVLLTSHYEKDMTYLKPLAKKISDDFPMMISLNGEGRIWHHQTYTFCAFLFETVFRDWRLRLYIEYFREEIADMNYLWFRASSMSPPTCSNAIYYYIYHFIFLSKYKCKTLYQ